MADDMTPSDSHRSKSDDWRANPRVGDVIRQRNPRYAVGRIPRKIVAVTPDRIETVGMSGDQRDGWMTWPSLRNYDLVTRGPDRG